MMKITKPVALAAALLGSSLLSACGTSTVNPATGKTETLLMSPEKAAAHGAKAHSQALKEYGGAYNANGIGDYVNNIGQNLARVSELSGQKFTFTVLDSPEVNAFALPGGYIYITRGLMALANDEAELAGVIGHEIGHVTGNHSAQRHTKQTVAGLGSLVAAIGASVAGLDPSATKSIAQLSQITAKGYVAQFSQKQELEADTLGVRYLTRAGYDAYAQADFLDSLNKADNLKAKIAGKTVKHSFFATHPATPHRVRQSIQAAQAQGMQVNQGAPRNRDRFLRAINGLAYGDNTRDGFVRPNNQGGESFYHVPLNIAFDAPKGWEIKNSKDAVGIFSPKKEAVAVFSSQKRATGNMQEFIARALKTNDVQPLTIDGRPAATTLRHSKNKSGKPITTRYVAIDGGNTIYTFKMFSETRHAKVADRYFQQIAGSYRTIQPHEKARLRPYQVVIHRVQYGDTPRSLAARTSFDEAKLQQFMIMNDLKPGDQLTPGQLVKLVQ